MQQLLVYLLLLSFACSHALAGPERVNLPFHRVRNPRGWVIDEASPAPSQRLELRLLLTQRNLNQLEAHATAVSNPADPEYGHQWSDDQIRALTRPSDEAFATVLPWLQSNGVKGTSRGDAVYASATVAQVERLFDTRMRIFHHPSTNTTLTRHFGTLSVPTAVAPHMHIVLGVSELLTAASARPVGHGAEPHSRRENSRRDGFPTPPTQWPRTKLSLQDTTPSALRTQYNIPSGTEGQGAKQAFVNFQGLVPSPGAIAEFNEKFNENAAISYISGAGETDDGTPSLEPDLDSQYISSIGSGVETVQWQASKTAWILTWAESVLSQPAQSRPTVFSLSYGTNELQQCRSSHGIADCADLGVSEANYVQRADTELMKLALARITVLVSSGDDGIACRDGKLLNNC